MNSAIVILTISLIAFTGDAAALCRNVPNEDMLEYLCEGGYPSDLSTIPKTTEKLRIIRMPLRRITADTFARFGGNLWVLSCSHCEITDIDADAFRRLVNLQQLSLDNNYLTTVKASWFEGLEYLTFLDLNYNNIREIENDVYKNLPGLVDFRISGNRLRCLNLEEMSRLKELKRIFLSENSEFACPHAVSEFLENQGVDFEQDPEWRTLASDTIDIQVPPSYVKKDEEILPPYRERLHPDRKTSLEEGPTRDRMFYPDHSGHRSRHKKPSTTTRPTTPKPHEELPVPRVEPIFPMTRPSHTPSESSPHQIIPYSTPETPAESLSEDIRMPNTDETLRTGQTQTYPSHPTYETTVQWLYPTSERPRISSSLEDVGTTGIVRPTEVVSTNSPYIPTMSYPSYSTERTRILILEPSSSERITEIGPPAENNIITYPLYVTTSDGLERTPHGSIQMMYPSSNSDMDTVKIWSTDNSVDSSLMRHEQSQHSEEMHRERFYHSTERNDGTTRTPYYGYDPRKMIIDESSLETEDDFSAVTNYPIENDRPRTTASNTYYAKPSIKPPELMYSPTDELFVGPYHESTITVHPLLKKYEDNDETFIRPLTTTDKPLPDCSKNSALKTQPAAALMTSIVVIVLGHAVVERF